jgi:hypothetical protein
MLARLHRQVAALNDVRLWDMQHPVETQIPQRIFRNLVQAPCFLFPEMQTDVRSPTRV